MEPGNLPVTDESKDAFSYINERPVDDISLEFFYKPHTITLLAVSIAAVIYTAFVSHSTVYEIMYWIDPNLRNFHIDMDKEYAVNCSDKALISVYQEFGPMWMYLLGAIFWDGCSKLYCFDIQVYSGPSLLGGDDSAHGPFLECWWDSVILDVLVCNGLGIWVGLKICKALEMREYKWVSISQMMDMNEYYKYKNIELSLDEVMSLNYCTYKDVECECYYRALFITLTKEDMSVAEVFLVDTGETLLTSTENILPLPQRFRIKPPYARCCHLAGLDLQGYPSKEQDLFLKEYVNNKPCQIKVDDNASESLGVYVTLHSGESLNDLLVQKGLARRSIVEDLDVATSDLTDDLVAEREKSKVLQEEMEATLHDIQNM